MNNELSDEREKTEDAERDRDNVEDDRDAAHDAIKHAIRNAQDAVKAMDAARVALTVPGALLTPPPAFDEAAKELAILLADLEAFAKSNRI